MKNLSEYILEALSPVYESTSVGEIPAFSDFDNIKSYFRSISGLSEDDVVKRAHDMFGFCVELYGGEWNGRHIYVTLYRGIDDFDGGRDNCNLGIWFSEANKKPKFDIFLMKKTSRRRGNGMYPGGSGVDGVQFDLTDAGSEFYGNKKAVDELFGKPMPWMRGSEKAVCETINAIIKEFGIANWQLIRKK